MIIRENTNFEEFYILEEGISDVMQYLNKQILPSFIKKAFRYVKEKNIHDFIIDNSTTARIIKFILVVAFNALAIKGMIQFDNIKTRNAQAKMNAVAEFLQKNPQKEDEVIKAVETEVSNLKNTQQQNIKNIDKSNIQSNDFPSSFIKKIKMYESGGKPMKKHWDVNAFRSGYGTYWKKGQPELMTDKEATEILLKELNDKQKLVQEILFNFNLNKKQLLPFVDIAFNAGEGTLIKIANNSRNYNELVKNSIDSAYVKKGNFKKLNNQILKRRLDMLGIINFNNISEEKANEMIEKYIKDNKLEITK